MQSVKQHEFESKEQMPNPGQSGEQPALQPWILVTDDSKAVCSMLKKIAKDMGLIARELGNFLELPRILREDPPVAVVLDLERPGGLSGPAIGRFIRQYQGEHIPIVVFSGLSFAEREKVVHEIDADASVPKGDSLEHLHLTLKRVIRDTPSTRMLLDPPGTSRDMRRK